MTEATTRHSLWKELRRRRVLRAAFLYAVVGLAFMEAEDIIFPAFSLPTPIFTALLAATLVGFPVVMVAVWMFGPASRVQKPAHRGVDRQDGRPARDDLPGRSPSEQSIAVLPFVNMSDDPENEYFSDGITEELINALTKIKGLHVAARDILLLVQGTQ